MKDEYRNAVCYLDTNIFIYMHDSSDIVKKDISAELYRFFISTGRGRISVQVISEWRNVMIRKYSAMVSNEVRRRFIRYLEIWNPLPITPSVILKADELCEQYRFSAYDSIHIQCALDMNCEYFLSEDMQEGLRISDKLTISNPYI
jgi:predicted nucleic acid-binding protein